MANGRLRQRCFAIDKLKLISRGTGIVTTKSSDRILKKLAAATPYFSSSRTAAFQPYTHPTTQSGIGRLQSSVAAPTPGVRRVYETGESSRRVEDRDSNNNLHLGDSSKRKNMIILQREKDSEQNKQQETYLNMGVPAKVSGDGAPARVFRQGSSGVPARVSRRGSSDGDFSGEGVPAVVSGEGVPAVVSGEGVPAVIFPVREFWRWFPAREFRRWFPAVIFRRVSSSGGGKGSGGGGGGGSGLGWWCE
ncbi:unnamed protein product [Arabidopsis thaliana]|uniref:Uncharacterized protein n=1 Tax=Arabidopsis thaliana TaxID=3702 RepID=A0A654EZB5_ARATH|nr:unnamed protein product [Arabidopsis thaliana]